MYPKTVVVVSNIIYPTKKSGSIPRGLCYDSWLEVELDLISCRHRERSNESSKYDFQLIN